MVTHLQLYFAAIVSIVSVSGASAQIAQNEKGSKAVPYCAIDGPVITVSVRYKSVTLKQFTFGEKKSQNGTKVIECPVGSEVHVAGKNDAFVLEKAFLKEGGGYLPISGGVIELRSKGRHSLVIVAQDFAGNVTETTPIEVDIVEP